jgi:hypothetical protein
MNPFYLSLGRHKNNHTYELICEFYNRKGQKTSVSHKYYATFEEVEEILFNKYGKFSFKQLSADLYRHKIIMTSGHVIVTATLL